MHVSTGFSSGREVHKYLSSTSELKPLLEVWDEIYTRKTKVAVKVLPERRVNSYLTRAKKGGGDWMSEGGGVVLAKDWPKVLRKWRGGAIKYLDWRCFWGNRWNSSDHWWYLWQAGLVFAKYLMTKRSIPYQTKKQKQHNDQRSTVSDQTDGCFWEE